MMRRAGWWLILAAVPLAIGLPAGSLFAQQRIIEVSASELTRQLAPRFPQRRCLAGIACVTLSEPIVSIAQDSPRLFVEIVTRPNLGEQRLPDGIIGLGARPRFDPANGRFYLDSPSLTRFDFPGVARESVATVSTLLQPLVSDMLASTPVWELDDSDPQQALARLLLREVRVRDGVLQLVLGDAE